MSSSTENGASAEGDDWDRARLARSMQRFVALMPLGTFAGCAAVVLCLWPVTPGELLARWFNVGLLLIVVLTGVGCIVRRTHARAPAGVARRCRLWVVAASTGAGLFWGASSVVLLPSGSPLHAAALALTLAAVTALWLPLFVIERITVLTYAVPVLLPVALNLLVSPPAAAAATMGSLLLILLAALVGAAYLIRNVLDADDAARRALYHRATHDALVGLVNHAEFERHVAGLETVGSGPYAIVFIDLDDFKLVNDTVGHRCGDRLLRDVGAILRDEKRKADVAARVGGDEFAILMQHCSDQEALRVARAVSARIAALSPTSGTAGVRIGASIGIACGVAGASASMRVVDAADRACYAAKRAGRNRIELAGRLEAGAVRLAAPRPPMRAHDGRSLARPIGVRASVG